MTSTNGFVEGGLVTIGLGLPNEESAFVYPAPVTNTSLPLATGLSNPHAAGEPVSMTVATTTTSASDEGADSLTVSATSGLAAGAAITVNRGGADQESATVSSVKGGAPGVALNCYQLTIAREHGVREHPDLHGEPGEQHNLHREQ